MTALTTTEKQRNRRRRLNEAAQAMGYHTWGKYETAVLRTQEIEAMMTPDYIRTLTAAPIYVKISDDDMMAAEVYNSETIRLTSCGKWLNPAEWTETEREFVAAARDEAAKAMAE